MAVHLLLGLQDASASNGVVEVLAVSTDADAITAAAAADTRFPYHGLAQRVGYRRKHNPKFDPATAAPSQNISADPAAAARITELEAEVAKLKESALKAAGNKRK